MRPQQEDASIYSKVYDLSLRDHALFELKSWLGRSPIGRALLPTTPKFDRSPAFLNLGAGKNIYPDWCNADFFAFGRASRKADWMLDLRFPLQCPSNHWDGVYCEHAMEHVHPVDAMKLMREVLRVLKPACYFRVIVPDLDIYLAAADGRPTPEFAEYQKQWRSSAEAIWALTSNFGHKGTWNGELLTRVLAEAGFVEVRQVAFGVGADPRLIKDSIERRVESLYVEGRKPAS